MEVGKILAEKIPSLSAQEVAAGAGAMLVGAVLLAACSTSFIAACHILAIHSA